MSPAGQLVGAIAIAAYLSSAFLPCKPADGAFDSIPSVAESRAIGVLAGTTDPTAHASHHVSPTGHGNHAERTTSDSHQLARHESPAVWMPTCLCGCSQSRAQIGGGTARLGPVLPVTIAVPLSPRVSVLAVSPAPQPVQAPDFLIDPIPT